MLDQYRRAIVTLSESLSELSAADGIELEAAMLHVAAAQIRMEQAKSELIQSDER